MHTIVFYFSNHKPIRFTGDAECCALQIANARLYPGFVSWEQIA